MVRKNKRAVSPGPIDLMPQIRALIAEPVSTKKKPTTCGPHPRKEINHDYCVVCWGGGEIVCCDKCPNSYHIKCHRPLIRKLPEGEWFCRKCIPYPEYDELDNEVPINDDMDKTERIMALLKRELRIGLESRPYVKDEKLTEEISIQRKHGDVKIPARKQLDKCNMIRKKERCSVCKRGILRGRLMPCNYCNRLYHLTCLDPPNRFWDRNMKWMCPEHTNFYASVYPEYFSSDYHGVLADAETVSRLQCEEPSRHINTNTLFNIPSHIDSLYKTPADIIPAAANSSFKVLCDVASFALNAYDDNTSNDISAKFLTHNHFKKLPKHNCIQPKQPPASLYCLSTSINTSIKKKSFSIGKNPNNNLCLSSYGSCEFISEYHATIIFDEKHGDYLLKNHSRHGFIVDNVSYFGSRPPKDQSNNNEFNKLDSFVKKHINKRRRTVRKRRMLRVKEEDNENGSVIIKYIGKKRPFDYKPLCKYYYNIFKKTKNRQVQCKCSKRLIPKYGYDGPALLRNGSMITIGCMKFKFTFDNPVIKEIAPKVGTKKTPVKRGSTVKKPRPLNGKRLKSRPEQENGTSDVRHNVPHNEPPNGHLSVVKEEEEEEEKMDCTLFNEQKQTDTVVDVVDSEVRALSPNENHRVDDSIILISDDEAAAIPDFDPSSLSDVRQPSNGLSDKIQQTVSANDLIQEFEVGASDCEEEYVYGTVDPVADGGGGAVVDRIANVQDLIIEEEVVVDEDRTYTGGELEISAAHRSESVIDDPLSINPIRDFKTEHLYCARDPREPRDPRLDEPIVISDDDD